MPRVYWFVLGYVSILAGVVFLIYLHSIGWKSVNTLPRGSCAIMNSAGTLLVSRLKINFLYIVSEEVLVIILRRKIQC